MLEKSPFSLLDFIKQRKRWVQGIFLSVNDRQLRLSFSKIGLSYSFFFWVTKPFQLMGSLVLLVFPTSFTPFESFLSVFNSSVFVFLFIIGAIKSFDFNNSRYRMGKLCLCALGAVCSIPFMLVAEVIAVIWGICSDKKQFYIVNKNKQN